MIKNYGKVRSAVDDDFVFPKVTHIAHSNQEKTYTSDFL